VGDKPAGLGVVLVQCGMFRKKWEVFGIQKIIDFKFG